MAIPERASLRQQAEALYGNPRIQAYLNMIANAEGTANSGRNGYDIGFGGTQFRSYRDHPRVSRNFNETTGRQNTTTAAGRYQFIASTWDGLANQMGLTDFSPRSQDLGAIGLLIQSGSVNDILAGNTTAAIMKDGRTWASLPSSRYPQGKRSWAEVNKYLQQGGLPPARPMTNDELGPLPQGTRSMFGVGNQLGDAGMFGTQGIVQTASTEPMTVPEEAIPEVGLPANIDGQRVMVMPETTAELRALESYQGYDLQTRGAMVRLQEQVKQAEDSYKRQMALFDPYPTNFDVQLRRLIELGQDAPEHLEFAY